MATICLPKFRDSKDIDKFIEKLFASIEHAKDLLIHRRFEKCRKLCSSIVQEGREARVSFPVPTAAKHKIPAASSSSSSEIQNERITSQEESYETKLAEIIDIAVILSIQAYAELNTWGDVIPFVKSIYGEIENVPPKVIQICLLLHAKVKEYIQCHALAKIWTQCDNNYELPGYKDVVDVYLIQILARLEPCDHLIRMLDNFKGLSSFHKHELTEKLKEYEKNHPKVKVKETLTECKEMSKEIDSEDDCDDGVEEQDGAAFIRESFSSPFDSIVNYGSYKFKHWYDKLTGNRIMKIWKIILMTAVAVFAFLHTQYGDFTSNLNRAMVIWQGVLKVFKEMFGYDQT